MAITQVLQGCGAWSIKWSKPLPMSVQREIQDGASLVVFESRPQVNDLRGYGTGRVTTMDNALDTALFMGPMTAIGSSGCSGWEMSWWWQLPNGTGPASVASGSGAYNDYFEDVLTGINGIDVDTTGGYNGAVWSGTYGPAAGPGYVSPPTMAARSRADALVAIVTEYDRRFRTGEQYSWKMFPGGSATSVMTCKTDDITDLFANDEVIISDVDSQTVGADGRKNVPALLSVDRRIGNIVSSAVVYGDRNFTSGTTPTETTSNTPADVDTILDPAGGDIVVRRQIDGGGNQSNLEEVSILAAARGASPDIIVSATLLYDAWTKEMGPGDKVGVHSSTERYLQGGATTVQHVSGNIDPIDMFVMSMTRNIDQDKSVWLRSTSYETTGDANPLVVWTEITDYIQTSERPASVTLSDRFDPTYLHPGVLEASGSAGGAGGINGPAVASNGATRLGDDLRIATRLARSSN